MSRIRSFLSLQGKVSLPGQWTHKWFDASRQQMILFEDKTFYIWSPRHDNRPAKLLSDESIPKEIFFAKLSMDSQLLAVQTTVKIALVFDLKTKQHWKISIKNIAGNQILPEGLIWSEHGGNSQDLCLLTSKGVELHKISSGRGQCKLSRSIMQSTQFFCYEPNFRALLLGCTTRDNTIEITGLFLRYDISDAPRLELPPPDKMPVFRLGEGASSKDLQLIVLYGTLYLAVHYCDSNNTADSLALYDLSRGQNRITQKYKYPLFMADDISISVTDNLLCCHCLRNQLTFLLDVRQSESRSTIIEGAQMSLGASTLVIEDDMLGYDKGSPDRHNNASPESMLTASFTSPVQQMLKGEGSGRGEKPPISNSQQSVVQSMDNTSSGAKELDTIFINAIFGNSHAAVKFARDNDMCLCPDKEQKLRGSLRHVEEPYSRVWLFLTPNWVWDPTSNCIWKIKCNLSAVVNTVQNAEKTIHFLSARGLPIEAPRPVYDTDSEEDGMEAKTLLFYTIFRGIVDNSSDIWFYNLFSEIAANYAVEFHQSIEPLSDGPGGLLQRNSELWDSSFLHMPPPVPRGKLRSPVQFESRRSVSNIPPRGGGGEKTANGLQAARRLINLARQARRATVANDSRIDDSVRPDVDDGIWDDTRLERLSGPFLPDVSDEPLEEIRLASRLPEIASIGQIFLQKQCGKGMAASECYGMSYIPTALTSNELQRIQPVRRNSNFNIIITQNEMVDHIWLPLSLEYTKKVSASSAKNVEFLVCTLKMYISSLKFVCVPVNASLSLLLLNLLVYREKFKEMAHIVQLQFFSDSPDFAVALLDMADTMQDACNENENREFFSHNIREVQYAISTMQQAGKDILWRCQEYGTVIRWMLSHGHLKEALRLCIKSKNLMKNASVIVAGIEFFRAALNEIRGALKLFNSDTSRVNDAKVPWRQNKYQLKYATTPCQAMSEDEAVAFLNSLHAFLLKWDSSIFSFLQSTGKSRLASEIEFPDDIFTDSNTKALKKKFGYII